MEEDIKELVDGYWGKAKLDISADEFFPTAALVGPGKEVAILPFAFRSSEYKYRMMGALSEVARQADVDAVILCIEAWILDYRSKRPKEAAERGYKELLEQFGGSLENVPGRVDVLILICVDRFGDKCVKIGEVMTRSSKKGRSIVVVEDPWGWMNSPEVFDAFAGDMVMKAWATSKGETVQ